MIFHIKFRFQTNSTASSVAGGDETKNKEVANLDSIQGHSSELKEENVTEKTETSYQETKIESTEAVDKILIDGISNIRIEQSRYKFRIYCSSK